MKVYKPSHVLYFLLLIFSIVIVGLSFLVQPENRWYGVLTGLGCGGVASVLVAWLLDVANCRKKESMTKEVFTHLFQDFDMKVPWVMETILANHAERNKEFDIDRNYSVSQVIDLMKSEDGYLPEWQMHYHNMGLAFFSIDTSIFLSYDPTEMHTKLYSELLSVQQLHQSYEAIRQRGKYELRNENGQPVPPLDYTLLCGDFESVERINSFRNMKYELKLSQEQKNMIRQLRSIEDLDK